MTQKKHSVNQHLFLISILLFCSLYARRGLAQAPAISYSGPQTYTVGTTIAPLTPSNTGGAPAINGQASTFAGSGAQGSANGTGTAASFFEPLGSVFDAAGNLYIADYGNNLIRKITPAGVVTTFAGSGTAGSANGTGTAASFYWPQGLAIDAAGNIYVADRANDMIRMISPAGVVTTLAGSTTSGSANGTGTAAHFYQPAGVTVDAAGNVFVADYGNNLIRKITSGGVVTTFAGSGAVGSANGTGTAASFYGPSGLAFDPSGNLIVVDHYNHMIRTITPAGVVTTLAGSTTSGSADGTGTAAHFYNPYSLAIDGAGTIYIADESNNKIRKITSGGVVTTFAGTGSVGSANGPGTSATFNNPAALVLDKSGNMLVSDFSNNLVRKVAVAPFTIGITALPTGLTLNTTTGTISGTPSVASSATAYSITAYNLSGSSTATLTITVNAAPAPAPSQNYNFIAAYTPRDSLITTSTGLNAVSNDKTKVQAAIQYADGLGRPLQTVQVKGSPGGRDIVQPVAYDQFGREAVKYLPYTLTGAAISDGSYKTTAMGDQAAFYTTPPSGVSAILYPSTATGFESSPLNRPVEQGAPGASWQLSTSGISGSGHTVKTAYGFNVANDIIMWNINTGGGATGNTYYAVNTLATITKTDENGNNLIEYKDNQDKIICKRVQNGVGTYLSTYYLYDDFDNLSYVIPPIPVGTTYPTSFVETDPVFLNFIYGYHYDARHRVVEKKIPGKGWEYMVYNYLDQIVADQDAVQRGKATQEWTFTKYDNLGRVILMGIYQYSGSTPNTSYRAALQTIVTGQTVFWETTTTTGIGYTANAWPASWTGGTLTINYYDNYSNIPNLPGAYNTPAGNSSMTKGLVTATLTNVLGSTDMLWTVHYYDDFGRESQTNKQHYLGGVLTTYNYDQLHAAYDFTNEITTTSRQHYTKNSGNTAAILLVTVANTYNYDHMGRKTKTFEQISNGVNILLAQNDFNEIGQVAVKHLHSITGASPFLQDINYAYNERGWLSTINDPTVTPTATKLFAEQLNYNVVQFGATPQFNGNIAEQVYTSISGQQHVTYNYDPLNRLTAGNSSAGYSENNISYDYLGNILSLTRSGTGNGTLSYTYTGNQLTTIGGFKAGSYVFDNNGNATYDGPRAATIAYNLINLPKTVTATGVNITYTYDAGGQKLRKVSNGNPTDYIGGIQYKTDAATIDFISTEEGRAINTGTGYNYEYTLTDHLGNNRVAFDMVNGKVGEDDYYPFGLNVHRLQNGGNNYLYNKKELQVELAEYDYGARFYDPVIARWTTPDPLAEKMRRFTPYNYGDDNPIRNTDPDGMLPPSDYYDGDGKKIGTDGHPEYQGKYVITDKQEAKQIAATNKAGGTTQLDDISSAKKLPSDAALSQSDKTLNAQVNGGTPNEKMPALVMPDGTVKVGQTGGAPVVTTNPNGTPEVTVPSTLPSPPTPMDAYGLSTTTTIHAHPTDGFTIGTAQFPAIRADGPLDAADASAFTQHQTNIIVGRLGSSTGSLGIAIYSGTTPALNLTQKAVEKILSTP